MSSQFLVIFIIYYIIFILHVYNHRHFYKSYFFIYHPKSAIYFLNNTITLLELIHHFHMRTTKSHVNKLINCRDIVEVFQHKRTAAKNPKDYYHVSGPHQGYDSFSVKKSNFQKLITEKDINSMTFYEKKSMIGNVEKYSKIPDFVKDYSVSKLLTKNNLGLRPGPVNQVEIGTFWPGDANILKSRLKEMDLSMFGKPDIIIEDYSDIYVEIIVNPKKNRLAPDTVLKDSVVEDLEWFYNFLENNEEMCSQMNDLLAKNPVFPLTLL